MSSSPSSSTSHRLKHHVFASFRGPDVRKTFMTHLFSQLKPKKINYFYDQDEEHAGKVIDEKIFAAIPQSMIALVVFSKNYANSKWCLNELVKILNCKRHHNLMVLPIFYVSVSRVKNWARQSRFEKALKNLAGEERENKRKEWVDALEAALEISGFQLQEDANGEAELIKIIVNRIVKVIDKIRRLDFLEDIIPVDHFADDVISLLNKGGEKGVRMVGIWGPEGIGKTVVAGVAFVRIPDEFEISHFVTKIGEANESNRLNDLLKELLERLGGEEYSAVIGAGLTDKIKKKMRGKKILLVLDGVTHEKQVEVFGVGKPANGGKMGIGDGSRILITTRDRDLLTTLRVDDKYIVNGLSQDRALQLFRRHALETEGREQGHEELSQNLTHYAGGHPLLLKALGSYVRDKPLDHWRTTLDKSVRSASSLFLPLQSLGRYERPAGGAGAHDHATDAGVCCILSSMANLHMVELDFPNESPIASIEDIKLSSRAYPFEIVGPFGVVDGKNAWKDSGYTDVREIVVYVGSNPKAIKSISIIYDKCGRPSDPVRHGIAGKNDEEYAIKLDYPSEYLTTISGHIGEDSGRLRSLTIITKGGRNGPCGKTEGKKVYGPYGMPEEKEFSFPYTGGKIVGFHGHCNGSYLKSIGAFYKPIPHTYPVKISEPFGSEGEKFWNFDDIKGIDARCADSIKSVSFEVKDSISTEPKTNYGRNRRQGTFKVKLKNGEHITSFAGYLKNGNGSGTLINSLTFQTNKRILGPIGREEGEYFSLPSEAGKVTGFFVSSDDYLKSIGAQVEPYYPFESVGPFGWERGSEWDHGNQQNNVRSIVVELDSRGEDTFIRSIKFQYENKEDGLLQWKTHGGMDGNELPEVSPQEIELDQDEYLTSISGYMLELSEETFGFTSLTFQTNKKTLKPIGDEKGRHFSSPATGGKIVGFYGRSGEHLNAIGAHFEPISHLYPVKSIGPFGGTSGEVWDDGKFDGVKEISVMHNRDIHHIKFVYKKGGEEVRSQTHGCSTKEAFTEEKVFSLDYPLEYLTSISGYKQENGAIIQSLTFYTNRRTFGPFGEEEGKYFWYPSTGSRIIGFYGRCSDKLNGIGVYAEPVPHMYPFKTIEPFGLSDGTSWDDGVHTDVRGFLISCGNAIHSIQIVYDNNGSIVYGSKHGGEDGPKPKPLWLDYPKERLVSISVCMDSSGDTSSIRDVEIVTTKNGCRGLRPLSKISDLGKHQVAPKKFTIPPAPALDGDGRIVGFFGSAGTHLNSIGARLESY